MAEPKRQGCWVNPLVPKAGVSGLLQRLDAELVSGLDGCWSLSAARRTELTQDPLVTAGALYPINPSSLLAASLLAPAAEHQVLDLAAAPGGKTLLMAAQMHNQGRIAAVEPVKPRFFRMQANLARCGVTNAVLYQADGRGIGQRTGARFDRILLDAPCSSEARIRLNEPDSWRHWSPRKVRETSRKQKRLLLSAFTALKPGGQLLYCTCAYSHTENEAVVTHLLKREASAQVMALDEAVLQAIPATLRLPGFTHDPGARRQKTQPELELACRVLPDNLWDGFFLCLLTKQV